MAGFWEGLQEGVQNVLGAPRAAGEFVFHHGLRAANSGLSMQPGTPTFGSAWSDGSCEAEYVNGRYRHVGGAVANGIDQMGGMGLVELVGGTVGVSGEAAEARTIETDARVLNNSAKGRVDTSHTSFDHALRSAREAASDLGSEDV